MRRGVAGSCTFLTPSASAMALAMHAGTLMQLPSARPLAPSGVNGDGRLDVQEFNRRDFAHGRHQIIGERAGEEGAFLVGDDSS